MSETLTPRQQAFAEHYAASGNAAEAAIAAGYSAKYARENAPKLLQNTRIQAALDKLTTVVSSERIATATERQEFWTAAMRGRDKYAPDDAPQQQIEMKDRLKASELLGKVQRDFVVQIDTPENSNIAVQLATLLAGGTHVLNTLQQQADHDSDDA